ncbi:CLUMA_CG021140, isoform A [Clunio marinus]|uniref:CLUMA_CG021140, isoform A n=1 Tax=Clunio marinus TaxID=568069 RepID=A0A1J1J6T3_9DIPT|nr:CLUMA_CG021140, isoform A [Clunio marinus]
MNLWPCEDSSHQHIDISRVKAMCKGKIFVQVHAMCVAAFLFDDIPEDKSEEVYAPKWWKRLTFPHNWTNINSRTIRRKGISVSIARFSRNDDDVKVMALNEALERLNVD